MLIVGLPLLPGAPRPKTAYAADYRSTIMADAPTSYWRLGQSGTSNILTDETAVANSYFSGGQSNGRPGAVQGDPNTATGFQGSAASYVGSPAALRTPEFTVEAWFNAPAASVGEKPIYRYKSHGVTLALVDGKPTAQVYYDIYGADFTKVSASTSLPTAPGTTLP